MNRTITNIIITAAALLFSCAAAQGEQLAEDVCQSYINTFCLRCHSAQRICDGIGSKSDQQWQDTIRQMGEYGNLDNVIQQKVYECLNSQGAEKFDICRKKTVSAEGLRVMTVPTVSESAQSSTRDGGNVFRSIAPEEALRMMQARDDVIFLDVRTPQERSRGAIPGSRLVPIYALLKGEIPLPKDKPILLVCAVGGRSYVAGQVLSQQGYREVYNLRGGVEGWHKAGLPLAYNKAAGQN